MWRTFGCSIESSLSSTAEQSIDGGVEGTAATADTGSRALRSIMRLLSKIIDAKFDSSNRPGTSIAHDEGDSPNDWPALESDLTAWYTMYQTSMLPDIVRRSTPESGIYECWFADETCAIASIYYHVCRLLLLMHDPSAIKPTAQQCDWLQVYRALCGSMAVHAREILAVALGRPSSVVQSRLVQPLYIAGRCLWREPEQRRLVATLRGIENDLGLATNYRIKALLQEWGTPELLQRSELDRELSDLSS